METQNDAKKRDSILEDPSPRCVLEIPILGTDSDHSISSSSDGSTCSTGTTEKLVPEKTTIRESNNGASQWKQMVEAFKKKSMRRFSVIPLLTTYDIIAKKNMRKKLERIQNSSDLFVDCEGILVRKPSWRNFDYQELADATDNFSSGEKKMFKFFF